MYVFSETELGAEVSACFFFGYFLVFSCSFRVHNSIPENLAGGGINHPELVNLEVRRAVMLNSLDDMLLDVQDEPADELQEWAVKLSECSEHCLPSSVHENCATNSFPEIGENFGHCDDISNEVAEWHIEINKF
jgi:hypothetical protein